MPFERPTLQQIVDRIEGDIKTRVDNASSFLRRSVFKVLARAYAAVVYTLYGYLNFIKDQLFATTADAEYLETIGSEYGITRKSATYATGECRATGTTGYLIVSGTKLQYADGQIYTVDANTLINISGYTDLAVTAEIAGAAGNQDPGGTLSFVSPLVGIDSTTTIDILGITGGVDQESDDDLRARVLTRKRQPPHGGAEFDYVNWALEVPGVTRAWAFPLYNGIGTIGVAFVRDNDTSTIIPNDVQRQEVYDYIVEHTDPLTGLTVGIPVTAANGLYIIPVSLQSFDMTILLNPNTVTTQTYAAQEIANLLLDKGGPGQTIYYSDMIRYLSNAVGVIAAKVTIPSTDVAFAVTKVPISGTLTFGAY